METVFKSSRSAPSAAAREWVGESNAFTKVKSIARAVAASNSTVLITGETGSGKEMLSRYIHEKSPRAGGPFIPVDCSAFSESIFESQLFGHVKGSFTGAMRDTLGFVRAADGGTLFLDEIGELTPNLQAKFLRVLQERCVIPVGQTEPVGVDVRVVCATNRDLKLMTENKEFRQDLFFRVNVVAMRLPPLRERQEDIVPLSNYFLARQAEQSGQPAKQLSEHACESLARYRWPGNVRELFNVLEHAHVLTEGPVIELSDLPAPLNNFAYMGCDDPDDLNLEHVEKRAICEALKRTGFKRGAASRLLGIDARRLNRRIDALQIALPQAC